MPDRPITRSASAVPLSGPVSAQSHPAQSSVNGVR